MTDAWNPAQYQKFADERGQPFQELVALIERRPGMRAVDLGCGPGNLTVRLHDELGCQSTLGVDSSPAMLARCPEHAGVRFVPGEIEHLEGRFDLIFSHAALQWVDEHPALLRHLTGCLAPHGQLAIQMPANFTHPSHVLAHELAGEEPFVTALGGYRRQFSVLPPEEYSELLFELGYTRQHVSLRVFLHVLESADAVLEWVKGTLLTDYEKRMSPELYQEFLARYRERLEDRQPYPYAFKRILLWASQP